MKLRELRAAADHTEVRRRGAEGGELFEDTLIDRVITGGDHDRRRAIERDAPRLGRKVGDPARPRKPRFGRELLELVDDDHVEPERARDRREGVADVPCADEHERLSSSHRLDERFHLSSAAHREIVGQVPTNEPGRAVGERGARFLREFELDAAAAHRPEDGAVRRDEHLRARLSRRAPRRPDDGDERVRHPGAASRERLGEELLVVVHGAIVPHRLGNRRATGDIFLSMPTSFTITVNGRLLRVQGEDTHVSLLSFLRDSGMTGSKRGCDEGDCGACSVALVDTDAQGRRTYRAINACIALLPMLAGREIVTVEGVGEGGLHPVQSAMIEHYGSQCGYCTPGFVVSMFEGFCRDDLETPAQIDDQLSGNLCRCTGYRPIRDAMTDALAQRCNRKGDLHELRLARRPEGLPALDYTGGGARFVRPTTLADLLHLRAEYPEAELVAGATEIGVYVNKKRQRFPLLISIEGVAELARVTADDTTWTIGGGASLTVVEEAMASEHPILAKMLSAFASRQIRSRATVAGNLVTASPIGDLAPVLLALDARVVLAAKDATSGEVRERTIALEDFFVAYRKTALAADEIVRAILVPRKAPAGVTRLADSFKVSKRRELDISIVAAAFVIDRDARGVVTHARLAYGGVGPTPIRARETERFLVGKPWTEATVRAATTLLAGEFKPIRDVRSDAPFRRGLVVSLFEKLWSGDRSEAQDEPLGFENGASEDAVGPSRALRHESALGHVTGSAIYVDDEAHRRGAMLDLWPVTSPHAHARIVRRDATAARAMPGVVDVIFAEDIPGRNDVGAVRHDEPLLARDVASFHGQVVALVVGTSLEACRAGAEKVEVEYEPLPAITTIAAAIAADSFHTAPHRIRRGDAAAALRASPHTLRATLAIGGQEHFYLETHAAWAERGDDGDVHVSSSTQHPSEIQAVVSHVLSLPRNKIVVEAPRMGGGFGGKETQGNGWAALAALAAWRTGRPVRVQLDRDVDLQITGKRHPFHAELAVGFDDDGVVHALEASLVSDGGFALDLSESILDRALFHIDNAYYLPALDVVGRVAKTNNVSHTAFRGFGGPQGMLVVEEALDRIARTLGLDPEVVRARNLYRDGGEAGTTHYGQSVGDARIQRIWPALVRSSELAERRRAIAAWNDASPRIKRGIAITPVKFGISFTASFLNQAGALVLVYRDGSVQVNHSGTEMGQGLSTKILGVAMRELGLPATSIRVMKTRTDKVPNTSATAASSGADLNGAAVKNACETLRERLAPIASKLLEEKLGFVVPAASITFRDGHACAPYAPDAQVTFAAVCDRAHLEQVSLSATGFYRTPNLGYDKARGFGKPFHYFAWGAAVTEVEVDGFSGMKRVRRVDVLHDVGDSLNPGVDRGQIEGGFVQGMGWLTGEELLWSDAGVLLTHSASTYQVPSIGDAPADFRVALLPHATQDGVIHGSKAVGEPPLMLAISVREAIRDAIAAFGTGGLVELPSPATHEAIFLAVEAQRAGAGRELAAVAEE